MAGRGADHRLRGPGRERRADDPRRRTRRRAHEGRLDRGLHRDAAPAASARRRARPVLRTLRLAEQLGGIAITLGGGDVAEEILAYARASNATRIVVGRARRDGLRAWLPLSAADRIVAGASDLEVLVVGREVEDAPASPAKALLARSREHLGVEPRRKLRWPGYAWAAIAVAARHRDRRADGPVLRAARTR